MSIADLTYLIVEDNDFQRRWLKIMLSNLGAKHIHEAADGEAALVLLQDKSHCIDICFIDLNLPGMDGMELIRHMAKSDNSVSIILASALDPSLILSVESMSHAYGVNLLGAVTKPATPEALESLITQHVPIKLRAPRTEDIQRHITLQSILQGLQEEQFTLHYQPKVELATGKVKGVEAFVFWQHPKYGRIAPSEFIPILERHGQIEALSWHTIQKVALACRFLHDSGHRITVSVNLSSSLLGELDFADNFSACFSTHDIDPAFITIEITESAVKTEVSTLLENLTRLRMKGFLLAVDDYGTGNISIHDHMRIPFSEMKIDRSFVVGAAQNEAIALALSSSLELAQKLKRESTAVGVETRQDWDLLQKLGCINAQGFYIAKPMEFKALPAWIDEWAHFF